MTPNLSSLDRVRQVELLTRGIIEPASYHQGRTARNPILPTNMICFVRRRADQLAMRHPRPRDQHHRYVLIVAVRGTGRVCLDAHDFALREGQALLIFPFQFHSYLAVQPSRICWVFLTFEMEKPADLELLRSSAPRDLTETEWRLLSEILRGWKASGRLGLLQHQLALLLGHLSARKSPRGSRRGLRLKTEDGGILPLVNRHVMARLDRPIVLKALAANLARSESHLRRRFRLATGTSLGRYLKELRLQRACSLLHDSSLSVSEVAAQCGFDSIYAFSRAFKNGLNLSPRAYRRRLG